MTEQRSENSELVLQFTEFLLDCKALQFGDFTLKSGRKSPYFINAGAFNTGKKMAQLGSFYAKTIVQAQQCGILEKRIDTIFGPAYKGIPLSVATSIALYHNYNYEVGYTFDRKEAKDHGDKGLFVGSLLHDDMNVLLVDDVMTAGTAVRQVVPKLMSSAKVNIVGMVLSVDRMEQTAQSTISAVQSVQEEFGFPVLAIANVKQLFSVAQHLYNEDHQPYVTQDIASRAQAYLAQYGATYE